MDYVEAADAVDKWNVLLNRIFKRVKSYEETETAAAAEEDEDQKKKKKKKKKKKFPMLQFFRSSPLHSCDDRVAVVIVSFTVDWSQVIAAGGACSPLHL